MIDKIQKIREEVEKLKSRLIRGACASQIAMETYCKEEAYNEVLTILDSMKEEPVSEDFEKKFISFVNATHDNNGSYSLHDFAQRLYNIAKEELKEPVSEDFEEALANEWKGYNDRGAATVDALEDNTQELAFAKGFYRGSNWQKEKALKESEDAIQYVKENHSPSEVSDFQNAMNISVMKAFDAGKEKKREQMIANAIDAEVLENYDGKVIKYDDTILDEKLSNCKVFDKIKVIVIKEK